MKKIITLLCFLIAVTGCKNTWEDEDRNAFYQSCLDEATPWAGSPEKAKTYCNCVTEKVMLKYPHESDALEHMDSVINDPDLQKCKNEVK